MCSDRGDGLVSPTVTQVAGAQKGKVGESPPPLPTPPKQLLILKERAGARGSICITQGRPAMRSHPWGSQPRPWLKLEIAVGSWLSGLRVSVQGGLGIPWCRYWAHCPQSSAMHLPCSTSQEACPYKAPFPDSMSAGFRDPAGECRIEGKQQGIGPSLPAWSSYGPAPALEAAMVPAVIGDPNSQAL